MFAATQKSFADALLDADRPVPRSVTSHTADVPQKRFSVYRNNVVFGLAEALRKQFPAVESIVGEEFFAAMARVFIAAHPPRSPLLVRYGERFPDFIAVFDPATELPYLADVARLEAARTRAYHAAEATPLDLAHWQEIDTETLHGTRVVLHPSAQILSSTHPIVTIWAMNSGEVELRPIEDWRAEDALVLRPHLNVEVRMLPAGGAAFLAALAVDNTLGEAAASSKTSHPDFDLVANLAGLIGAGVAIDLIGTTMHKDATP